MLIIIGKDVFILNGLNPEIQNTQAKKLNVAKILVACFCVLQRFANFNAVLFQPVIFCPMSVSVKQMHIILFFFFFPIIYALGQEKAIQKINVEDLQRHLSFLASDSLQGRGFATEVNGLEIAADYLAEYAQKIGLKPGAHKYFQHFDVISTSPVTDGAVLKISRGKNRGDYETHSMINLSDGADIQLESKEIVFVGFGLPDEKTGCNQPENIDIKGKVAMMVVGSPSDFDKSHRFEWNYRHELAKMEKAKQAGAVGVLLVASPLDTANNMYERLHRSINRSDYQIATNENAAVTKNFMFVPTAVGDAILSKKGAIKKKVLKMARKKKANPFALGNATLTAQSRTKTHPVGAKNVIGIVEGSDPDLKNECVVFMAHYDHLGMDKNGDVFNGADDNGSGTVTLMEVAEAFMALEKKPKRSIVFLWVTGEEVGMLGSGHYTENPVFALAKTVACINIDMDGRVYEPRDSVWHGSPKLVKNFDGLYTLTNDASPAIKTINTKMCRQLGLKPDYSLPKNFLRSSDHYHFHRHGVPVINYATGYHADYHKTTDEVSRIDFNKIKRVADLCFLVGMEIANNGEL